MLITCNRILFPSTTEDDDEIMRQAKMAKNIRKRKVMFHFADVEKIGEHEDKSYTLIWFYYSEPIVIEYPFQKMEQEYRTWYQEQEDQEDDDNTLKFFLPLN
jgi:hypothetical protein